MYIDVKNKIEKTHEDDKKGIRKTVIFGEADNGYIVLKRTEKKAKDGYYGDPDSTTEQVFVYRENPLKMEKDEEEMNMSDYVGSLVDQMY